MNEMEREIVVPDKAEIKFGEDRILKIRMLPGSNIDLTSAVAIVEHAAKITDKELHCNFIDIRQMTYISSDAQKHFSKQNNTYVPAIAVLMVSTIQKKLVNMYFSFLNPMIPTRAFDNEEEAMVWLRKKLIESEDLM
jgi:hypothetical protein